MYGLILHSNCKHGHVAVKVSINVVQRSVANDISMQHTVESPGAALVRAHLELVKEERQRQGMALCGSVIELFASSQVRLAAQFAQLGLVEITGTSHRVMWSLRVNRTVLTALLHFCCRPRELSRHAGFCTSHPRCWSCVI